MNTAASATSTATQEALADNWLQWAAENRLRGCTPESMVDTMAAAGLDRAAVHSLAAAALPSKPPGNPAPPPLPLGSTATSRTVSTTPQSLQTGGWGAATR